jgi:hypothetical protein
VKNTRPVAVNLMTLALVIFLFPATAFAAGSAVAPSKAAASSSATANAPYATGPIDSQYWPAGDSANPNQLAIITDIQLAPSVKLPARVRVPIAQGATIQWAGEILGGVAGADPERTFKIVDGAGGGKYAEFTLEKSRRGQIDGTGGVLKNNGDIVSFASAWIQSVETSSVLLSVRLPAGVSRVKISPQPEGTPQTNMQGESLYAIPVVKLAVGQKQDMSVVYSTNPSGAAPANNNATMVLIALGVLLVGAVGFLAYAIVKQRQNAENAAYEDDTEELDDEDLAADEDVVAEPASGDPAEEDDLDLFTD